MKTNIKTECIVNKSELHDRKYYNITLKYDDMTVLKETIGWRLEPEFLLFIIHSHISEKFSIEMEEKPIEPVEYIYVDRFIDIVQHVSICKVTTIVENITM